jgi:hypothetical protein
MRQLNRFVGSCGRRERNFTEAQIIKFTNPRDHHSFARLAVSAPRLPTKISIVDAVTTAEPESRPAVAKGAFA